MSERETIALIENRLASHKRLRLTRSGLKRAAVALPLLADGAEPLVLFTVRTDEVEHHKGETSFPGGRMDDVDSSLKDAALREMWEEVGIEPEDCRVLGYLDDRISISGYLVTPVVVYVEKKDYHLKLQPTEVKEVLKVPLGHLLDLGNYKLDTSTYRGHPIHRFYWGKNIIWGLTAGFLYQFLNLVFGFNHLEKDK